MPAALRFWRRVGSVFRANGSGGQQAGGNGRQSARPLWLAWRRGRAGPRLAEGQRRLVELAAALQEHFQTQDRHAAELNAAVERVASMLGRLCQAQSEANQRIDLIAQRISAGAEESAALSAALGQMPATLQAQAEAVRAVGRQLEIRHQADAQLREALEQLGRSVAALRDSGAAQVELLGRLRQAGQQQHEALTALLRQQGRRLTLALVTAGVLGLVALAVMLATVWRR